MAVTGTGPEPGNHVSVIDANSNEEIDTVEVGLNPFFVAFNPNNGMIYVTNSGSDTVFVISTTLPTPQLAVQKLIDTIDNMDLNRGTTASLEATLNAAVKQLNRNNDEGACNQLDTFLHKVGIRETKSLTSQQATDLRQQAIAIQDTLGCSSSSSSLLLPSSPRY